MSREASYWGEVPSDLAGYISLPSREDAAGHEPAPGWDPLGEGVTFAGAATSVGVDNDDNVYVFNRGPTPVVVLDNTGTLLRSYGVGLFDEPHAVTFDADNNAYFVDTNHFIRVMRADGTEQIIGHRGKPSRPYSGEPFNRPTDVAVHPGTNDLYITDGYANARVHRFAADGSHLYSWGTLGSEPGQFHLPHGIAMLDDDHLVVCDRENFRLQIFDLDGTFVDQWPAHRPCAVRVSPSDGLVYVAEIGPSIRDRVPLPNLGRRISVLTRAGERVGVFGDPFPGYRPDQFVGPHGIAVDSHGGVYVAEITGPSAALLGGLDHPGELPSLRKWAPVRTAGDVVSGGRSSTD